MSAVDLDRQSPSIGGAARSGARTTQDSPGWGSKEDAGAFGALLDGLSGGAAEPAPRLPAGRWGEGRATGREHAADQMPEDMHNSPQARISRLISGAFDGEKADGRLADARREAGRHGAAPREPGMGDTKPLPAPGEGKATQESTRPASDGADGADRPVAHGRHHEEAPAAETAAAATTPQGQQVVTPAVVPPAPAPQAHAEEEAAGRQEAHHAAAAEQAEDAEAPAKAPVRVTVLTLETHFAPVGQTPLADPAQAEAFVVPGTRPAAGSTADQRKLADEIASDASDTQAAEKADRRRARGEPREDVKPVEARDTTASARREAGRQGASHEGGTGGTPMPIQDSAQQWTAVQQGLPLSNLRQVSTAIGNELARIAGGTPGAPATAPLAQGPVRLLDIQLHPAELGTVTVRLRSSAAGLEVRLHASNPETARMLKQDQARLTEILRAEGLETADITVVDGSDGSGAWSRFEMLPRPALASASAAQTGDDGQGSDQRQRGDSSRDGRNEGEDASGRGGRPGRDRG